MREQLAQLAALLDVKQEGLADYLGVSRVTVNRWMKGHDAPRDTNLIRLSLRAGADVLRVVATYEGDRYALLLVLCPGTAAELDLVVKPTKRRLTPEEHKAAVEAWNAQVNTPSYDPFKALGEYEYAKYHGLPLPPEPVWRIKPGEVVHRPDPSADHMRVKLFKAGQMTREQFEWSGGYGSLDENSL